MKGVLIAAAAMTTGLGVYRNLPEPINGPMKAAEVQAQEKSFAEYLKDSAKAYGVPVTVAFAMAHQESGGKMAAIRYEPGQVERAKKLSGASGENLRMYASSHCALQVMGWHAPGLGMTWADLYNPRTCAETGMKIMADCMHRHKGRDPLEQTHQALKCFNGGDEYARTILNRLGQKLLKSHLETEMKG